MVVVVLVLAYGDDEGADAAAIWDKAILSRSLRGSWWCVVHGFSVDVCTD